MARKSQQQAPQTLGEYVTMRRIELGMTQSQLSERSGLTRAYVSGLEHDRIKLPDVERRRILADALRVRNVDLLIAAGELTPDELGAPIYRDHIRYGTLHQLIDDLPEATAATMERLLRQMTKD